MSAVTQGYPRGSGIQQVRVAETVAGELRRRILRGDFPNGALPKKDQLREEYGISHPSLREALSILVCARGFANEEKLRGGITA